GRRTTLRVHTGDHTGDHTRDHTGDHTAWLGTRHRLLVGLVGLVGLLHRLGCHGVDLHRRNAVASAGRAFGGQRETGDLHLGAGDGDPAEVLGHQSADRVDVLVEELETEQFAQVVHVHARAHAHRVLVNTLNGRLGSVVLVDDLPHDLLEDVLDRHQAGGSSVLVDDDGHVRPPSLHLAEQVTGRLGVRYE